MSTIPLALADYSTQYLYYDKDKFYSSSRSRSGSFGYHGYTYDYGIASSVYYWSYNHYDTDSSSVGTIRVAGGASINNPAGAESLGILRVKTELILHPLYKDWWWWWVETRQHGEIAIRKNNIGTVNLAVATSGDGRLRDILEPVADLCWVAMTTAAGFPIPFDPLWIMYLNSVSNDWNAGPYPEDPDPDAYVEGVMGWQYPAWKPWCFSEAEVAYDFLYSYYKRGASGWKKYEVEIKITVDFGYVEDTYIGLYRNVRVTTQTFSQKWRMYVNW
jgi:hypothetical protein